MDNEKPPVRAYKDQVVVRQVPPKETVGALNIIIAPQGSETWDPIAVVLDIGPGVQNPDFAVGDRVYFKRRPCSALVPDSREQVICPDSWKHVLMLRQDDILMVIE